ncbi:MAG: metal ABC transporter permease [Thermoplasmata archaeon]|nr:metal ABC transporter permease [Thermoplasmata archaeon]
MVDAYIVRAIIAIILLAINASIAGSFTIFRNVTFLVVGSAHAALAGAALAILLSINGFNMDPMVGAILFAIIVSLAASKAKEKTNIAIGIVFALSMSLAVIFISAIKEQAARVWGLLFGDLLLLTDQDIAVMVVVTVLVIILSFYFSREFLFISFDKEGARANGINVDLLDYLLLSIIAISTVVIMKGVGAILVYAMLVAPAAAANETARSIIQVFFISGIIALFSGLSGIAITIYFPIAAGAVASLIASLFYIIFALKK